MQQQTYVSLDMLYKLFRSWQNQGCEPDHGSFVIRYSGHSSVHRGIEIDTEVIY